MQVYNFNKRLTMFPFSDACICVKLFLWQFFSLDLQKALDSLLKDAALTSLWCLNTFDKLQNIAELSVVQYR